MRQKLRGSQGREETNYDEMKTETEQGSLKEWNGIGEVIGDALGQHVRRCLCLCLESSS
jgi:hypothetical protein